MQDQITSDDFIDTHNPDPHSIHSHFIQDNVDSNDNSIVVSNKRNQDEENKHQNALPNGVESTSKEKFSNELLQRLSRWKPSQLNDDYRIPEADNYYGGKTCLEKEKISVLRGAGKEILKKVGKSILLGKFNLTTISFPIKCMVPKSFVQTYSLSGSLNPCYLTLGSMALDPVEKMKFVITNMIANLNVTSIFNKPLNPVIGETFTGEFPDGSKYFAEQTCHKPPITHYQFYGPNNSYIMSGHTTFTVKAGFNSVTLKAKGARRVEFEDGTKIDYSPPDEFYSNAFTGTVRHETVGKLQFIDRNRDIHAEISIANVKKKPSDYFEGFIKKNGVKTVDISGTYMGYIEFNGRRYWDVREQEVFHCEGVDNKIPSDSRHRKDIIAYELGDLELAQRFKEELEHIQRTDAKNREQVEKEKMKKK